VSLEIGTKVTLMRVFLRPLLFLAVFQNTTGRHEKKRLTTFTELVRYPTNNEGWFSHNQVMMSLVLKQYAVCCEKMQFLGFVFPR